jgi:hypothetical protein
LVCFVDRCLSFCTFSFGHCVVCSSIYGFWLSFLYFHALFGSIFIEYIQCNVLMYARFTITM